jgi:hypothetical protein
VDKVTRVEGKQEPLAFSAWLFDLRLPLSASRIRSLCSAMMETGELGLSPHDDE